MAKLRIALADDEILALQALESMVQTVSGELEVVGTATNGVDALQLVREQRPDILLTDIRMPRMDGIELTRRLEEMPGAPLVIIVSAYDDREYIRHAIQSPLVYDYINKPFPKEEFAELLRGAADYRRKHLSREEPAGAGQGERERKITALVAACLGIIERRLGDKDLSVAEAARELEVTPNYLSSRFSRDMEMSFTRYVTMLRIERAKEHLEDVRLKIYEVSALVGFEDVSYFDKIFKERVGVRPSEYRNQITLGQ